MFGRGCAKALSWLCKFLDVKERERGRGLAEHLTARGGGCAAYSDRFVGSDDPGSDLGSPDFPDADETGCPVDAVRAEVHDEELVLVSVEDFLGGGV